MADIFISYSKAQHELTQALAGDLEAAGYSVWWDTNLLSGVDYRKKIDEQIAQCQAAIVIWSPASIDSMWVRSEADHALKLNKLISTLDGCIVDELPKPFGQFHAVNVNDRAAIISALKARNATPGLPGQKGTKHQSSGATRKGRTWAFAALACGAAIIPIFVIGYYISSNFENFGFVAKRPEQVRDSRLSEAERLRADLKIAEAERRAAEADKRSVKILADALVSQEQQKALEAQNRARHAENAAKSAALARQAMNSVAPLISTPQPTQPTETYSYVSGLDPQGDGFLALRETAGGSTISAKLGDGTLLKVIEANGVWRKVILLDGRSGWAHSNWIACCRLASAAAGAVSTPDRDACNQLWLERNSVWKRYAYCFTSPKAIDTFGNGGCFRDEATARAAMEERDRKLVDKIASKEHSLGCY